MRRCLCGFAAVHFFTHREHVRFLGFSLERMKKMEEKNYQRRRRIVSILSLAVFLALFLYLTFAVGGPLVRLAEDPDKFREWIDAQGALGRLIFLGIQLLQVVVALIPGEVIEIGAGYAFGAFEGTLLCLAGVAVGSALIFGLTRLFGVKLVEAFISREKINELKFIKNEKRLNLLIFLVFFIPGTPKDLLTYFVGLTPVRFTTFLTLSTIARIPSVVSSTFGGHALGEQNYGLAIAVFAVTAAVSLLGLLVYNRIVRRKNQRKELASAQQEAQDGSCASAQLHQQNGR